MERYRLVRKLGEGGMGEVYLADDTTLNRPVAVKFLKNINFGGGEALARFEREIRALCVLAHPNIVKLLDVGEADRTPYYVMEFCPSMDLARTIQNGPLPLDPALAILDQLLDAVDYLHGRNVIHRDIKPSNVLVADGRPILTDFGIVLDNAERRLTVGGLPLGTPLYMAPELFSGTDSTCSSDLWAIGVLSYEMLTGVAPFTAPDLASLPLLIHTVNPAPIQYFRPDVPKELGDVIARFMEKEPDTRWSSAKEARAALRQCPQLPGASLARRMVQVSSPENAPRPAGGALDASQTVALRPNTPRGRSLWPWTGAALGLALLGLAIGMLRYRASDDGAAGPGTAAVGPAERPRSLRSPRSVEPIPAAPPSPSVCGVWTQLKDAIRKCDGPHATEENIQELRRASPIDFGRTPKAWLFWSGLCDWLMHPGKNSRPASFSAHAVSGLRRWQVRRLNPDLSEPQEPWAKRVVTAFELVRDGGEDAPNWLLLGYVLDLDGQHEMARTAYQRALSLLPDGEFASAEPFEWGGLVNASRLPGHDLTVEWFTRLPPAGAAGTSSPEKLGWMLQHQLAWRMLVGTLGMAGERKVLHRMVQLGLEHPRGCRRNLEVIFRQRTFQELAARILTEAEFFSLQRSLALTRTRAEVVATIFRQDACRRAYLASQYRLYFHREPENESVFVHHLHYSHTTLELQLSILSSDEYYGMYQRQPHEFIRALYWDTLQMEPDLAGNQLEQALEGGTSRRQVVMQFLNSQAVREERARSCIRTYLSREPTVVELKRYTAGPCDLEQLLPALLSSGEYFPLAPGP